MEKYDPKTLEQRWYQSWESAGYFAPSGEGVDHLTPENDEEVHARQCDDGHRYPGYSREPDARSTLADEAALEHDAGEVDEHGAEKQHGLDRVVVPHVASRSLLHVSRIPNE